MSHTQNRSTRLIHGTSQPCEQTGALAPPLVQTSTFVFRDWQEGARRFAGEEEGYVYTRLGNPTVSQLEEKVADLEGAEAAVAFASGMGAVSGALMGLLGHGDHLLCSRGIYGCTHGLLGWMKEKMNVCTTFVDRPSRERLEKAVRPETKVLYLETPVNPTLEIIDLNEVCLWAKERGIKVVVDNTFATPILQRPLEWGADLVLHSATKYIGGHGDVIGGVLCGSSQLIGPIRDQLRKDVGAVLSPFDAWLLLRGIRTLAVRMERHVANAEKIARLLLAHPAVKKVDYPGLPNHPQYRLAQRQMDLPGGMVSFQVCGGLEGARLFLDRLKMCLLTVSLGDVATLVQHPASMTHAIVPEEERSAMGITDDLIRLSVGIEDISDIWTDLEQALHPLSEQVGECGKEEFSCKKSS
ncbi:trans-sulfuration enzyme family protein [Desmospora profundinema]|uniref:Methionine-gamma-lyase n=1 Tax=Desmospora profundinema TaxID=1571184 RepID=A0ABU1IJK8_9BACL|nr:aminotransferase class I/II-fold pyridoxal phosphate-dependent enzyme [Desmospora profundinema]MDR6224722.1 methionine-gamma-lyase [Desmospora profundinema]